MGFHPHPRISPRIESLLHFVSIGSIYLSVSMVLSFSLRQAGSRKDREESREEGVAGGSGEQVLLFFLCLLLKHLNPCPLNHRHLVMLFGIIFISTVLIPFKL